MLANDADARAAALRLFCRARSMNCASMSRSALVGHAAAHAEPPALCYSSVWLSMNCLVLDPKTVIVEASEVYQQEEMDKLGRCTCPDARPHARRR